jgi:preprotein translocase subunit SecA
MKTGEGKTLVATLPASKCNNWKGVPCVNSWRYLANRDQYLWAKFIDFLV